MTTNPRVTVDINTQAPFVKNFDTDPQRTEIPKMQKWGWDSFNKGEGGVDTKVKTVKPNGYENIEQSDLTKTGIKGSDIETKGVSSSSKGNIQMKSKFKFDGKGDIESRDDIDTKGPKTPKLVFSGKGNIDPSNDDVKSQKIRKIEFGGKGNSDGNTNAGAGSDTKGKIEVETEDIKNPKIAKYVFGFKGKGEIERDVKSIKENSTKVNISHSKGNMDVGAESDSKGYKMPKYDFGGKEKGVVDDIDVYGKSPQYIGKGKSDVDIDTKAKTKVKSDSDGKGSQLPKFDSVLDNTKKKGKGDGDDVDVRIKTPNVKSDGDVNAKMTKMKLGDVEINGAKVPPKPSHVDKKGSPILPISGFDDKGCKDTKDVDVESGSSSGSSGNFKSENGTGFAVLQLTKQLHDIGVSFQKLAENDIQKRKFEYYEMKTHNQQLEETQRQNEVLRQQVEIVQQEKLYTETELTNLLKENQMLKDVYSGQKLSSLTDEDLDRLTKQFSREKKLRRCCVLCLERIRGIICLPCGHLCMCFECASNNIVECPLCCQPIQGKQKCYI